MRVLTLSIVDRALAFEPRAHATFITRLLLALAELIGVVTTPDGRLFTSTPALPSGMRCSGTGAFSLWCIGGPEPAELRMSRVITLVVLLVVMTGYRPRLTCIPHWYVTISLTTSVPLPYGADTAALVATMLFIPLTLGDRRIWQWSRPAGSLTPAWRGSAYIAWWMLRVQISVIYLDAMLSKLTDPAWLHGTAIEAVLTDPSNGLPYAVRGAAASILTSSVIIAMMTWGVLAIEASIAFCALLGSRARRVGVFLAIVLHVGIVLAMGLVSFSLTMMAIAITLCLSDPRVSGPGKDPRRANAYQGTPHTGHAATGPAAKECPLGNTT